MSQAITAPSTSSQSAEKQSFAISFFTRLVVGALTIPFLAFAGVYVGARAGADKSAADLAPSCAAAFANVGGPSDSLRYGADKPVCPPPKGLDPKP